MFITLFLEALGDNSDGQLDNGNTTSLASPVRLGSITGVVSMTGEGYTTRRWTE